MTTEKCVECGSSLRVYDIDFQTSRKVMRCEQCGLLHIYKKDILGRWHIVRATRPMLHEEKKRKVSRAPLTQPSYRFASIFLVINRRNTSPKKDINLTQQRLYAPIQLLDKIGDQIAELDST